VGSVFLTYRMNTLQGNPLVETREIRKKKVLGDELDVGSTTV
jgi:hypothetical protein